jgi:signal transduction histidine kinase
MSRRTLVGVFAIVLCLPAATLIWLAARLMQQDRDLESQRLAERRELAAADAVQALSARLADPRLLTTSPGPGAILVRFPDTPLLFQDSIQPAAEAPPELFQEAESLEFQHNDPASAIIRYTELARAKAPSTRAAALYRLARALHAMGRDGEALDAYARLGRLESATIAGWPAPVAAAWGRCSILAAMARHSDLKRESAALLDLLISARYPLTRSAYEAFAGDASLWSGRPRPTTLESLTTAVLALRADPPSASGRSVVHLGNEPITLVWSHNTVFAASSGFIEREWLRRGAHPVWLRDDRGFTIGTARAGAAAVRHPIDSDLPWTIFALTPPEHPPAAARRKLLLVFLVAVGLFTLAGAAIVLRALRRELTLARMQEDFVAAVSHEFRTPLTTLLQLTEALEDGRVASEDRRIAYYRSLSRATQRLNRLVEDLLDFRRMQSGAFEYRRTTIATSEFTEQLAADFQREVADLGFHLHVRIGPAVSVLADREALARAIWNLLDNAVKYSGSARTIELAVVPAGADIEWTVRDHGMGIPAGEQPNVFQKFFRGAQARHAGIRGTGIGLAMVAQIAAAHGGRVSVSSREGGGSLFTLSIPIEGAPCSES